MILDTLDLFTQLLTNKLVKTPWKNLGGIGFLCVYDCGCVCVFVGVFVCVFTVYVYVCVCTCVCVHENTMAKLIFHPSSAQL